MTWLQYVRLVALGISVLCGIIVLSLGAHLTSLSEEYFESYYIFAALNIAVAGLTTLTIPVMVAIDCVRTGAITSMVLVELAWLSILWVLWIAAAAYTAEQTSAAFSACDFIYPILNQVCNETRAMEAFGFLAWIVLLAYTIVLLVVALLNSTRGAPMWTASVKQRPSVVPHSATAATLPAPATATATAAGPQMATVPHPQPTAPYQHASSGYPGAPGAQAGVQHGHAPMQRGSPATAHSTTAASPSSHGAYPQV